MAKKSTRRGGRQTRAKTDRGDGRKGVRRARGSSRAVGGRQRGSTMTGGRRPAGGAEKRSGTRPFPQLKHADGCGAFLVVGERVGGEWDQATHRVEVPLSLRPSDGRGGAKRLARAMPRVCRALAAFGHVQRAQIMAKLLEGPATYRALQQVTKMKAGPLYHHVNQLRLAGLILPKQRDLYELTRGGRNLILAAIVVGPIIRDARRRPVGRVSKTVRG